MSRFENRKKIEVDQKPTEELKGRKVILESNGKVPKKKKMFHLSEVLIRAVELYAFEKRIFESDVCTEALEKLLPKEFIDRAEKEIMTL